MQSTKFIQDVSWKTNKIYGYVLHFQIIICLNTLLNNYRNISCENRKL